jgi:hypothetical protein
MVLRRVSLPSPNYSSRAGAAVTTIVLHTAQGATNFYDLGAWFQNPASGVSSQVGIDDTPGAVGEYVLPTGKAWTQGNANPWCVSAELCAFAEWDIATWNTHPAMLENCAAWVAEEAARFGIPILRLGPADAQDPGCPGVCQHVDLGAMGGGHWDCGPAFPIDQVLALAVQLAGGAPAAPARKWKGHNMIAATSTGKGYWCVTHDGAVNAFGDAQYKGGGFNPDIITGEVVGIAGHGVDGYWLYASDGGIHAFGSAAYYGRPDRF